MAKTKCSAPGCEETASHHVFGGPACKVSWCWLHAPQREQPYRVQAQAKAPAEYAALEAVRARLSRHRYELDALEDEETACIVTLRTAMKVP